MENNKQQSSLGAPAPNDISFLAKITHGIEKVTSLLNKITHSISMVILMILMFLTFGDVFGRYFFSKPITGAYELTGLMLALMIFFSLGIAQLKGDHIEIDFLTTKFPAKVQECLNVVKYVILFIILVLASWQLFELAKRQFNSMELSGDIALPLYIFASLSAIGLCCFALTFLLDIFKSLLKVVQK